MRVRGPLLSPVGEVAPRQGSLADRPGSLAGKRVGLLDNTKPGAEEILRRIGQLLVERHGVAAPLLRAKPSSAAGVPEAVAAELAERCDLIITGVGD
jgi:hypothetical protein